MRMEERNNTIDECIALVKSMIYSNCGDHTPYYGACVSCGRHDNPEILPDPETVMARLEALKELEAENGR